jgi:hypothetical protein
LPNGTANGVVYANGSKVLTTGSALTFDGTTLGLISSGLNTQNTVSDTVDPISATTNQIRMGAAGFMAFRIGTAFDFNLDSYNSAFPINVYNVSSAGVHKWSVAGSEQMRLTSTGLGIGTSTPYGKLTVLPNGTFTTPTQANQITVGESSANTGFRMQLGYMLTGGTTWQGSIQAFTSGVAGNLILNGDGGNVGIGTSSPGVKLDVVGVARASTSVVSPAFYGSGTGVTEYMDSLGTTGMYVTGAGASPSNSIRFFSVGTTTATLDSSGNLGLGVTPSANSLSGSGYRGLEVGSVAGYGLYVGGYEFYAQSNTYYNSGFKYANSGRAALQYVQASGQHQWFTAPSGTAGNAISFSQVMTLDANGNLGVGTTSPGAKLDVAGTARVTLPSSVGSVTARNSTTAAAEIHVRPESGKSGWISFTENAVADRWIVGVKNGNGGLFFNTGSVGSNTDRMTLDSSGNLIQTVNTTAATLTTNQTLTFSIVDNSTLRISVRGSDGTTRTATVALT